MNGGNVKISDMGEKNNRYILMKVKLRTLSSYYIPTWTIQPY